MLYVRNTLASAAAEGARLRRHLRPWSGRRRRADPGADCGAVSGKFAEDVSARQTGDSVEVTLHARVPALGLGGPGIDLTVTGHAVEEPP